jgi:hypothetical protein
MRTINVVETSEGDMLVTDFWEQRYLPFVIDNMKPSTVSSYKQVWNQHLKQHFAETTLQDYRTHVGSALLLSLTKTQGRRTLNHIRSLASGIFTHAVNEGRLESNPWRDVKILGKVRAPKATPHYTLEEAANIISALVEHVECQLMIALCQLDDCPIADDGTQAANGDGGAGVSARILGTVTVSNCNSTESWAGTDFRSHAY